MNIDILVAFIIGRIILSASPGAGVVASITKAVSDGFKESLYFLSGIILCNIIFLLAAIYGISTISKSMSGTFFIIKLLGGVYLIILGIKLFKTKQEISQPIETNKKNKNFAAGFLLTAGNPEPILFYASVVPALLNGRKISYPEILLMIVILVSISFIVTGSYCYFASLSRNFLLKNDTHKYINRVAGFVMCLVGCYVIIK